MDEMTIGKRIMTLRKENGMTQDQLAERVGVSPQAVSKWENDISCPDISILPALAAIFGVSTDELLGVKPIEPKVVVVDRDRVSGEPDEDGTPGIQIEKDGFRFQWDGAKRSGIWFALFLLVIGAALLFSRTNLWPFARAGFWDIVWPAALLGLGVSWSVRHLSPLSLGAALLGLYYLLYNLGAISLRLSWSIVWPLVLVLIGLSLLIDALVPRRRFFRKFRRGKTAAASHSEENGYVECDCAFSDERIEVSAAELTGAHLDNSFGKLVLDASRCTSAAPNTTLYVDASFGSVEILLPRCIRAELSCDRSFASTATSGTPLEQAEHTVYITGDVSFGSLTVRYV